MRIAILGFFMVFITTAQKCSDERYTIAQGEIMTVNAPDTVTLGKSFSVFIEFSGGTNGCAEALRLDVESSASEAVIVPYYRTPNDTGLICTMAIPVHELETSLRADSPGIYTVRNAAGDLSKAIVVITPPNE